MAKKSKNVCSHDQNGRGVNYEFITIATRKIQEKYHFCFVRQRVNEPIPPELQGLCAISVQLIQLAKLSKRW